MPRTRAQTASTYSNGDSDPEMDLIHHQMRIVEVQSHTTFPSQGAYNAN